MGDVVRCVVLKPVAHVSTEWIGPGLSSAQQPFLLLPLVLSTPSCKSRIHGRKQKKALPFPLPPATGSSLHLSGPSTPPTPPFWERPLLQPVLFSLITIYVPDDLHTTGLMFPP